MGIPGSYDDTLQGKADEEVAAVTIDENAQADWTEAEETSARRKIDFILLPILMLAFFALQMDRGNISNALTSTITKDLGVTTNKINVGSSLLSVGIVLLELPSNILLQRIGPQRWLSGQIFAWGLVAVFQSFITTYAGFLVTRVLLGLCEAGFIPGALYTMSTWYTKKETSSRISIFFLGNILASATVSLIGAGILSMSGRYGLAGWRWLFIIEGIISIGIGFIFLLFLPPNVGNGSPLISAGKWSYFSQREQYILVRRVILDDPTKTSGHLRISGADIKKAMLKGRIWVHFLISLMATMTVTAIQSYGPSIIKSLGFGTVRANAMASVGNFIAAILVVILGFVADKTKRRGPTVLAGGIWSLIAYACLLKSVHYNKWHRYAAVVAAMANNSTIHILNVGWLSINCKNPQERSIAMAMIIIAANAAGIAGSQIFRTEDAPVYIKAFTALLALSAGVVVVTIALMLWYIFANRRLARVGGQIVQGKTENLEISRQWWWVW
ncbi:transporter-like protein [Coleophoma crateriformis]|uniref:Transporter-like protein n=1 Tax=Coleophoma crateriformis TaxID=565419 RepID=A0A3D8T714_9HELO|nr:transporter-like protein [Coleophoma crateriformis]